MSPHHNDNTEIYVDLNNSKLSEYDGIDYDQDYVDYGNTEIVTTKRITADF